MKFIGKLKCFLGMHSCRMHSTPAGIGGRCVRCLRVFGWMTAEELRRLGGGR